MKKFVGLVALLVVTGCTTASPAPVTPAPVTPAAPATPAPGTPAALDPAPQTPSAAASVSTIWMMDGSQGWALGEGSVLRTVDGGRTWAKATPPGVTIPEQVAPSPKAAYFLNSLVGWLSVDDASSKLWRTADGGKTWESLLAPKAGAHTFSFADAQHGWWLAHIDAAMGSEMVELYGTGDGGKTWTMVNQSVAGDQDSRGSIPLNGFKTGTTFRDASNGWAGALTYRPGSVWLQRTRDGGHTWLPQTVAVPAVFRDQQLRTAPPRFFTSTDGILPVTFLSGWDTVFYRTRDGGDTWTPTTPVKTREASGGRLLADFADADHGWSTDGTLLYTTVDGGATWKTLTPGTSLAGAQQLDFVNAETGWAVIGQGKGNLLKTTDGGATWTPLTQ